MKKFTNFRNDQYEECYWSLLNTLNISGANKVDQITYSSFAQNHCIFAAEIVRQGEYGSIAVELKFSAPSNTTLTGLLIGEFGHTLLIDSFRNVTQL